MKEWAVALLPVKRVRLRALAKPRLLNYKGAIRFAVLLIVCTGLLAGTMACMLARYSLPVLVQSLGTHPDEGS
jgi:hypothetical protein